MKSQVKLRVRAPPSPPAPARGSPPRRGSRPRQSAEIVGSEVLHGRQDRVAGSRPALASSARTSLEVAATTRARRIWSATRPPPGGPVTPPSRRCEKTALVADRAEPDVLDVRHARLLAVARAATRLEVDVAPARESARTPRGPRRRPRSSRPRARADRRVRCRRPRRARAASPRRLEMPPARPRQPACSIATPSAAPARPAGSRRRGPSARRRRRASPGRRPRSTRRRRRLAMRAHLGAVDLAAVREVAPRQCRAAPRAVVVGATARGSSSVWRPRFRRRTAPSLTPPSRGPCRAPARR